MESLESKLDRLSPEQRKETEDFVDFLLSRSGQVCRPRSISEASVIPDLNGAPPSLVPPGWIAALHGTETRSVMVQDPVDEAGDRAVPVTPDDAACVPFREIGGSAQDRITHDYMDYGQFEKQLSPVPETAKKVRRQIIAKEEQDKPRHLLDWVG